MELLNTVETVVTYAVIAWGAWMAGQGAMLWAEGNGSQSSAKKDEGGGKMVGGGVIILIGLILIPKIFSYLSAGSGA